MKGSLLTTQAEVIALAQEIGGPTPPRAVAIDTETTGFDVLRHDVIRGMSVSYRTLDDELHSHYVSLSHPDSPNLDPAPLIDALHRTGALHVLHNASFDWSSLAQVGFVPRWGYEGAYYDTGTVAWLENENAPHALKKQGKMWFGADEDAEQKAIKALEAGLPSKHFLDLVRPFVRKGKVAVARQWAREMAERTKKSWATFTAEEIAEYAAKDTDLTLRLFERQRDLDFGDTDPRADFEREFRVRESAYRMVREGVRVDVGAVEQLRDEYVVRAAEIDAEFADINLGSVKQLRKLIYEDWGLPISERTPGGEPSTNHETLTQLAGLHEGLDRILERRRLTKIVGTYLNNFLTMADDDDRIHSSINPTGTVTGRFSSSKPNMQNLPTADTDPKVKKLFRARPGFELIEIDLQSAELFVGASITNDTDMMGALTTPGRDFHTETAIGIFGTAEGNYRRLAKNLNYGIPYGIGAEKFAKYLVVGTGRPVTEREIAYSRTLIKKHRLLWPQTHRGIRRLTAFAQQYGYVPLHVPGRYRHFHGPGITVPAYTAFNAVVQGGVAELVKDWMITVEPVLLELGAVIVLQVHDSLWIEVPVGTAHLIVEAAQRVLDDINPFRVRLTIDSKRLDMEVGADA